ncbi:hypothetical protein PPV93_14685, partial [Staphylococcus aureus]|nr:hypothetical protein [Staphylococcus aureus]
EFANSYRQKIKDASVLDENEFRRKYKTIPYNYKNKTIVANGGNSEGGAGAKYQGAKHPNEKVVATDSAMI